MVSVITGAYNAPEPEFLPWQISLFLLVSFSAWLQFYPMRLDDLIAELDELESDEKLQWLVEFANELPPLSPGKLAEPFPETCRIQECQTPVHLWVEVVADKVHLEADVPQKSPTVRGLVALIVCGLEGATVSAARSIPDDMVSHAGLSSALGMTRQQGFRGVISRLKQKLSPSERWKMHDAEKYANGQFFCISSR
jgi:cysteine desulfuration protein SufE